MEKNTTFEKAIKVIGLVFFLIIAVFPIYWLVVTSFKPLKDSITVPIQYWPKNFTFQNYIDVWNSTDFPVFFRNSLIVAVVAASITTLLAIFAGYALARYEFRGKNLTLMIFLITQMIPIIVLLTPLFLLFRDINLLNKLMSLIISYAIISIPFCTVMLIGFFQRIPKSLEESAMIDGCSKVEGLFKVVIPIMLPGIVATFVFAFIAAWNEFFFSIMFINSESMKTIPVGISMFIQKVNINWAMMATAGVIAMLPPIILFMFIQKYLVAGLTAGAVKG